MAEYRGVSVFCEVKGDRLLSISQEGLGIGRKLANELGQELFAVLAGSDIAPLARQAIAGGADKVYLIDSPLLKNYQTDSYLSIMKNFVDQVKPQVLILGQNDVGRDLAPRLAFRLGTTVTMDCIELSIDPASKRLLQTKPVYGGNALAVFTSDTNPQLVTIRTKAMPAAVPDESRHGEVITLPGVLDASVVKTKVLDRVIEKVAGVKLEDARVVVAGGRGLGSVDGFKPLGELAALLKGAVGASRPPCDNGWISESAQVGLTGKIVAPELYIAIAISGSSQHMSGCSGSKTIVAINKDKEANIFRYARYGVVGDWKKVLPAFTAKIKELLAS